MNVNYYTKQEANIFIHHSSHQRPSNSFALHTLQSQLKLLRQSTDARNRHIYTLPHQYRHTTINDYFLAQ